MESITATRLGKLTSDQLGTAFAYFDLGRITEVSSVPFSNWGQNIFVTTTAGEFVLRGAPNAPDQFYREQYFIRQLAEHTAVPVPWPYRVNPSPAIFGWAYAIMPRLPGRQIGDDAVRQGLGKRDSQDVASAMGLTLSQMHGLEWPYAGTYDHARQGVSPFAMGYRTRVAEKTRTLLQDFQRYVRTQGSADGEITDADLEWADRVLAEAVPASETSYVPTLVMGDYHERNVVADKLNGCWTIQGVFDFATAHVGDGEADLSRCFATYHERAPALARTFLASYLRERPPPDGFRERFAFYMLSDRAHIWAFGYSRGMVWWDRRLSFRDWVHGYLTVRDE